MVMENVIIRMYSLNKHASFSSNIHYALNLMVNNSNAPTFQLGKAWSYEGRKEAGLGDVSHSREATEGGGAD